MIENLSSIKSTYEQAHSAEPQNQTSRVRRAQQIGTCLLKRLILVACVIGLCLLALEGLTRTLYNRVGMHFGIEMWKYAKQLKRTSSNPAMGHEHIPNQEAFLMGVPVRINSAGLRDRETSLGKPAGTYRILALGDSTTLGWGAHQEQTYAKLLEQKLNALPPAGWPKNFEVINAGVGNYNTAQEVAYFLERGRHYKPDMVLLGFFINDAEETPHENTNWLARESCLYVFSTSAWDGILRSFHRRPDYREYYLGLYEGGKPGWLACQHALRQLMATCAEESIDLRIVIIPELHKLGAAYEFGSVHQAVRRLAQERGVPVIDLLEGLANQDPRSLWVSEGDAHPNDRAHELFATQLYAALVGGLGRKAKSSSLPAKPEGTQEQ